MFSATGPLYRLGTLIYKYLTLNVLFLAFCIPVVTIPAATAGLFAVARKIVYEKEPFILREFMRGFRKNFKQSLIVGLVTLIVAVFLWMDYRATHLVLGGLLMCVWAVAMFIVLAIFVNVYPLMVHMHLTIKHILLNSVKISMIKPFLSISIVVLTLGFLFLAYIIPILFFTFFFSVLSTTIYYLVNKKFEVLEIASARDAREDG
ncbi:DUF624 domain-containing protein [Alicyclobacillus fastidiosus]|uniref:DUF624 domain-containing protein n=1 Tax=Alicyclobacillus fastidiosus TaxID=392011 RepID=A0ABY6ZAE1_9BACL|nr:DUF624 domain-containing protein [Alicyclobacillus fastidiosus]WAH39837.1 DUF624 domain-containing protein [Alicyclobacillus fastidiosus]GMA61093.1 hypothetical protein GCM10025859_15330 [Alicyclobacillus fastidiosus]